MGRAWWSRFLLLIFFVVLATVYVIPTVGGLDPEKTKFPFTKKINLGLDLQGGLYLVLGADFNKVMRDVVHRQGPGVETDLKEKGVVGARAQGVHDGFPVDDPRIVVDFEPSKRDEVYKIIKTDYTYLRLAAEKPGHFEFGLTREYKNEIRERTINQSKEVIRNRIDEFGVAEPAITTQGVDRIVVELPGIREVDRAKALIGQTARLEFKLVDTKQMSPDKLMQLIADIEKQHNVTFKEGQKFSDYVNKINEHAKGKIPAGLEIAFQRENMPGQAAEAGASRFPYLLKAKAEITGEDLQDAQVTFDRERGNQPQVAFRLTPRGAGLFDKVTTEHTREQFAIVLDNVVKSAPVINERIPNGSGVISLGRGGGDQLLKEAKDLAIVLRAGALPTQLDFLEQRVVGPSLGQDSIKKGAFASLIGCLAVFVFVLIYYRVSGAIAVLSLVLNVLFVLAILVGLDATLTLPGIAGIALTVGIAVDSNVVIYERIREELRHGKSPHGAVESGFQKAFRTILDANVTNAAAALVLMVYGTGPIKGFAVTMMIGIVTTLFTAVFVCKLIFDWYLRVLEGKRTAEISI
ncbi:protein translocase subunit SecD [bacterium]|jgi:protein-export membrane protein SecD|nr:protein translocase subunit SecD [bacterium]